MNTATALSSDPIRPAVEVASSDARGQAVPRAVMVPRHTREQASRSAVAQNTAGSTAASTAGSTAGSTAASTAGSTAGSTAVSAVGEQEPDPERWGAILVMLGGTGTAGEVYQLDESEHGARWVVGMGSASELECRQAGAALIRAVHADNEARVESGADRLHTVHVDAQAGRTGEHRPVGGEQLPIEDLVYGLTLGGYRYRVSLTHPAYRVDVVRVLVDDHRLIGEYANRAMRATELAAATSMARDLANAPANVADPAWLACAAGEATAGVALLESTVRDERWLAERGFGGLLAVGGGSARPPRLVELSYEPESASTHLLLVGKGITFDTGGISVKPADGMHLMRTDMSGAAAVVAAMRAIARLNLNVRVTGLMPCAENHVSGAAYRPGDVLCQYGGQTTEISNTDAEGRIVLADALVYGIEQFAPDAVVDVATLTGAMKVALGVRTGGIFASDDELATRVRSAGKLVREPWWIMPLLEEHAEAVRSEIADLKQAPQGPGGVTAALFLREFVAGVPWAHLDIAGPARAEETFNEVVAGGTGFAARTLVELAASYG